MPAMKKERDTYSLLTDFIIFTRNQFKVQEDSLKKIERDVTEIKEELHAVAKAVDKDAVTVINHENRITRLEKLSK